jgi:hypothetical protein
LNHDKQIQSLLCYRYTIGQSVAFERLNALPGQSSRQTEVPQGQMKLAHGFNRGLVSRKHQKPRRGDRNAKNAFCRPFGTRFVSSFYPRLKPWAIVGHTSGADSRNTEHGTR